MDVCVCMYERERVCECVYASDVKDICLSQKEHLWENQDGETYISSDYVNICASSFCKTFSFLTPSEEFIKLILYKNPMDKHTDKYIKLWTCLCELDWQLKEGPMSS